LDSLDQSAEDGASGIIRAAMDHKANPGDFYGPSGEVWNGFTDSLIPDDI